MSIEKNFVFDYWPTGSCDMQCLFCYGAKVPDFTRQIKDPSGHRQAKMYIPTGEAQEVLGSDEARPELSLQQSKAVLRLMKSMGGDTVTVAGGEPSLREDTPKILAYAKRELGMSIYLSTNGTYTLRRYDEFKDNIDVLGLPLDGSSSEMNVKMGRRPYLFKNITAILTMFRNSLPEHIVKVGTIVSKKNIDDIANIGQFLFRSDDIMAPHVWRLYQFESIGRGAVNAADYVISADEFTEVCDETEARFPEVIIRPRSNEGNCNAYFFISPDGILQTVNSQHHVSIVDLTQITEADLIQAIGNNSDIAERANKNRNWLNPVYSK